MSKDKMVTLFSYGSVILPSMTEEVFGTSFTPLKSVFISGYKLVLKHANSKEYPDYHNIICTPTLDDEDVIPGFLVEVPCTLIDRMDKWEGSNYVREEVVCLDRNLKEVKCEMYVKRRYGCTTKDYIIGVFV